MSAARVLLAAAAATIAVSLPAAAATIAVVRTAQAEAPARIPLVPGLVIVGAVVEPSGDSEPILTVRAVGADAYDAVFTMEVDAPGGRRRTLQVPRRVRLQDHRGGHAIRSEFWEGDAPTYPGTTPFLSGAMVTELRAGSTRVTDHRTESLFGLPVPRRRSGTLTRVSAAKYTVLVNGRPTELPVIRARGTLADENGGGSSPVELLALDDPELPLFLYWKEGGTESRIVRIDYPDAEAARARLEAALARREPYPVYGVYFAFASAALRTESERTLRDVAAVLAKHPDWKLRIEGHTDSIGGADANLALSTRRAEAVRDALVRDHAIAAQRLVAAGRGAGAAVAPNDTAEGRARNRRVVLSRW